MTQPRTRLVRSTSCLRHAEANAAKLNPAAVIGWPQPGCGWLQSARRVKLSLKLGGVRGLGCEGHGRIRRVVHGLDQARSGLGDPGGAGRGRAPRRRADAGSAAWWTASRPRRSTISKSCGPDRRDGRRSGSSSPSTPPGQRCCSWAATRQVTGHAGTATTSRSPSSSTSTTPLTKRSDHAEADPAGLGTPGTRTPRGRRLRRRRSRLEHAGCSPRAGDISSPRPASSSAWHRKTSPRRSG